MHTGYQVTVCFTAASFREVEMNDQQIQTEAVEPMEPHVETRNMTQQQGACLCHCINEGIPC